MNGWRIALAVIFLSMASGCNTYCSITSDCEADKEPLYYTIPMDILCVPLAVLVAPLAVPIMIVYLPKFAFHG